MRNWGVQLTPQNARTGRKTCLRGFRTVGRHSCGKKKTDGKTRKKTAALTSTSWNSIGRQEMEVKMKPN